MAAVGMIIGLGYYFEAIVTTLLFLFVLNLRSIEPKISKKRKGGVIYGMRMWLRKTKKKVDL